MPPRWAARARHGLGEGHDRLSRDLGAVHIQFEAVALVVCWTAVVARSRSCIVKVTIGLRVTEEEEREGLDISSHGERAYDM